MKVGTTQNPFLLMEKALIFRLKLAYLKWKPNEHFKEDFLEEDLERKPGELKTS